MSENNRLVKIFIKTFLVTTSVLLLTSGGVLFAVSSAVSPPEVPSISVDVVQANAPRNGTSENLGIDDSDAEPYDTLSAPHLVHFEDRKPSFFTFLIFGLTEGNHANTVMVAAYDAETKQSYIISIPRDTRVDFQRNRRKIVSAYLVGRLNGGNHQDGAARLKYEVSTLVGFKPDFYISINYDAFTRVVDSVGGVEVNVPFHMRYDDPHQNLHINIPAGLQTLDGRSALHFARYRLGNDRRQSITDYQRMENQQQVLTSVVTELLTPASILRIPEFISIFNEYIDSNLTIGELTWFATQARHINSVSSLNVYTLPMLGTSGAPHWYELADETNILELVNRTVNPLVRDITSNDLRIIR